MVGPSRLGSRPTRSRPALPPLLPWLVVDCVCREARRFGNLLVGFGQPEVPLGVGAPDDVSTVGGDNAFDGMSDCHGSVREDTVSHQAVELAHQGVGELDGDLRHTKSIPMRITTPSAGPARRFLARSALLDQNLVS